MLLMVSFINLEHFIVWMQMETLPTFRKLWGRIPNGLSEGKYNLVIDDCKNV